MQGNTRNKMVQKSNISNYLVSFVIAVCFYLFNSVTPYYSDDWWYAFIHQADYSYPTEKVESIGDIVTSQINHYQTVNGRLPVTFVVQAVVSFCPKWAFDIINTILFVIAVLLTARLTTPRHIAPHNIVVAAVALFFLLPGHYETLMWATGAINYLWVGTLILTILLLWHKLHTHPTAPYLYPLLFILGFLAGWTNEALSFGLAAGVAIELLLKFKRLRPAHYWLATGIITGACMILFAPGSWNRLDSISQSAFTLEKYLPLLWALILPALLAIVMYLIARRDREAFKRFVSQHSISLTAACTLLPVCLITYQYAGRSLFGMALFCLIPLLAMYNEYIASHLSKRRKVIFYTAVILFTGLIYSEHCRLEQIHRTLIESSANSADGTVALNTPQRTWYATPYTLNLDTEYRLGHTAQHMAAYYNGKPLQWISVELNRLLNHPEELFSSLNKVQGNNYLYTTDKIEYYILHPEASMPDSLQYYYTEVSFFDPVPLHSRLLRWIIPGRYPAGEKLPAYHTTLHINNVDYICIPKNHYRNVTHIENGNNE